MLSALIIARLHVNTSHQVSKRGSKKPVLQEDGDFSKLVNNKCFLINACQDILCTYLDELLLGVLGIVVEVSS
jgi:hypothetical protein